MLKIPERLKKGDRVALLAASSPLEKGNEHLVEAAVSLLESWGLDVWVPPTIHKRHLYFAGRDEERAQIVLDTYLDPTIKGIFFTRGGYGAPRLYSHISRDQVRGIHKIIVGYSDVTSLLVLFQEACGMVVYHGPNLATERILTSPDRMLSQESLRNNLFDDEYRACYDVNLIHTGVACGEIVGGNLSRVVGTIGTQYELNTTEKILFLEDTGKSPQQIDAMVTHLRNAGKLDGVRGIVFGDMAGCHNTDILWEAMREFFAEVEFPVVSGLPSGHGSLCVTLPLGGNIRLDADSGKLEYM